MNRNRHCHCDTEWDEPDRHHSFAFGRAILTGIAAGVFAFAVIVYHNTADYAGYRHEAAQNFNTRYAEQPNVSYGRELKWAPDRYQSEPVYYSNGNGGEFEYQQEQP